MIDPDDIPFFAGLTEAGRTCLRERSEPLLVRAGKTILRRGERGRFLFSVASGGVTVETGMDDSNGGVFLGPGEVFGEMSIMSGLPASAPVVAAKDSHLHALPKVEFLQLLETEPELRTALANVLVHRIRRRERSERPDRAMCAILSIPAHLPNASKLASTVLRAIEHYAPGSMLCEVAPGASVSTEVRRWRESAGEGRVLVIAAGEDDVPMLERLVDRGDVVVRFDDGTAGDLDSTMSIARWGLADHLRVRLIGDESPRPGERDRWHLRLTHEEVERAEAQGSDWNRKSAPGLDHLARWTTRRLVGVALGAGAARGFAHLGVLAALEAADVPIDCLSGSSMGGIAALLYGLGGSGPRGIQNGLKTLGRDGARKVKWLPRSSFLSDRELRRRAAAVADGRSFADLPLPVAVVAADLVRGERVVIDRGPVDDAFFATAAIPGALPPVETGDRLMVDGALVSRIPVDLLDRCRCGLRVAVNVIPAPGEDAGAGENARRLRRQFDRFLGFRSVLARSWELLGWRHGAADAAGADVIIEPRTSRYSGYDFSTSEEMVDAGRLSTEEKLDEIQMAATELLRSGARLPLSR